VNVDGIADFELWRLSLQAGLFDQFDEIGFHRSLSTRLDIGLYLIVVFAGRSLNGSGVTATGRRDAFPFATAPARLATGRSDHGPR
jgi:hypothetical protein